MISFYKVDCRWSVRGDICQSVIQDIKVNITPISFNMSSFFYHLREGKKIFIFQRRKIKLFLYTEDLCLCSCLKYNIE